MKGDWKKYLAVFMAVAMLFGGGVFVTTQSFQATDDESYDQGDIEDVSELEFDDEDEDYDEEEIDLDDEDEEFDDEEDFEDEEDFDDEADGEDIDEEEEEDLGDEIDEEDAEDEEDLDDAEAEEGDEELTEETAEEEAEAEEETAEAVEEQPQEEDLAVTMPEGSLEGATSDGTTVSASFGVGVFPAGVTMQVTELSKEEALDAVGDAVENAVDAVAIDITFYDKDGNEVQPKDGAVQIEMGTRTVEGEQQSLVHVDDAGNAEVISTDESADGASFEAESFSVYVLVGHLTEETETVKGDGDQEFETAVGSKLTLHCNASQGGKFFGGEWAISEGEDLLSFAEGADTTAAESDSEHLIEVQIGDKEGDACVTYTYEKGDETLTENFRIHIRGGFEEYTVHFDLNGGSGSTPETVKAQPDENGHVYVQMPSAEGLTRDGYTLMGWTDKEGKDAFSSANGSGWGAQLYQCGDGDDGTDGDVMTIEPGAPQEQTVYAAWVKTNGNAGFFTIALRKSNEIMTEPADYSKDWNEGKFESLTAPGTGFATGDETNIGDSSYVVVDDVGKYISPLATETSMPKVKANITDECWEKINAVNEREHFWDPETEYVQFYVIKNERHSDMDGWTRDLGLIGPNDQFRAWHLDGVIRSRKELALDYDPNCTGFNFTGQAPVGKTYTVEGDSVEVTVEGKNTLERKGYDFAGWNTKRNGSGQGYKEGDKITLTEDTILYAQWLASSKNHYAVVRKDADTGEEIDRREMNGTTGKDVSVADADKALDGYLFDENNADNKPADKVADDGSTELVLYFTKALAVKITAKSVEKPYDKQAVPGELNETITVNGAETTAAAKDGGLSFSFNGKDYTIDGVGLSVTQDGKEAEALEVGGYDVTVNIDSAAVKDANGKAAGSLDKEDGTITITPRYVLLKSADGTWDYDGKEHKAEEVTATLCNASWEPVDGDAWLDKDEPTYLFKSGIRAPGSKTNTFTDLSGGNIDKHFEPNYVLNVQYGTLTVNPLADNAKYEIDVAPVEKTYTYDGQKHGVEKTDFEIANAKGITAENSIVEKIGDLVKRTDTRKFTLNGEEYTIAGLYAYIETDAVDAGDYPISVEGRSVKITDADGQDVTGQFSVNCMAAILKIEPREVKVESKTLTKEYDGKALTNDKEPLQESGWADGEGATYDFTGSQTAVGESANAFGYTLQNNTKESNYKIIKTEGKLIVSPRDTKYAVTVTPQGSTVVYDGNEHAVNGFENEKDGKIAVVADNGQTYYVTGYTASATGTDAGEYPVSVTSDKVRVEDEAGNKVTEQFSVNVAEAKLVVTKRAVTLQSADLEKNYDGEYLTNPKDAVGEIAVADSDLPSGVAIPANGQNGSIGGDGFAAGEGATYYFEGKRKLPGTSENRFQYRLNENTKSDNYEIRTVYGSLNVKSAGAQDISGQVVAKSGTFVYDGTEKSVSGFENEQEVTLGAKTVTAVPVTVGGKTYYVSGLTSEKKGTDANVDKDGNGVATSVTGTPVVYDEEGEEVVDGDGNPLFNVTPKPGVLTIQKRPLTLTSKSLTKLYDGNPLTNGKEEVEIGGDGLIANGGITYDFTGSQTLVGGSDNSFDFTLTDAANRKENLDNYDIKTVFGTLLVTAQGGGEKQDTDKVAKKTHSNGVYAIGQSVKFTLSAKNIYAEKRTITFAEQSNVSIDQAVFENVSPGATVETTATYTVTEDDANAGGFTNTATVEISDASKPNDHSQGGTSFTVTDDVVVETPQPSISVVKQSLADGEVKIGDTVDYKVQVFNNGNVKVNDIEITDELTGDTWTIASLATGQNQTFDASYTVTAEDVLAGKITNTAVASGKDAKGGDVTKESSVTDEVDQNFKLTVHFVDSDGNWLAADYQEVFRAGEAYRVDAPHIEGYTPEYAFIESDENGMPTQDVELTVHYTKNPVAAPETPSEKPTDKGTPSDRVSDDDDDDAVTDKDTTKKDSEKKTDKKSTDTAAAVTDDDGGNGTPAGTARKGNTPNTTTPEATDETGGTSNAGGNGGRSGGARITIADDGSADLVSADDTETPLMNLDFGDHKCNVLRFIILLAAMVVVVEYTRRRKEFQARMFELREKKNELE